MSIRQKLINRLVGHGIIVSGNELEVHIFHYKKVYNGRYRGIDLLFDMLDYEEEFSKFLEFINNRGDVNA